MSYRRRKREIEQQVSQRLKNIESRKDILNRSAGKNLFETIHIEKKFGPVRYEKSGLKLAPDIMIALWFFHRIEIAKITFRSVRLSLSEKARLESMILQIWRLRISVINWTIRKKVRPKGSIGNYLVTITFQKP